MQGHGDIEKAQNFSLNKKPLHKVYCFAIDKSQKCSQYIDYTHIIQPFFLKLSLMRLFANMRHYAVMQFKKYYLSNFTIQTKDLYQQLDQLFALIDRCIDVKVIMTNKR